MKTVKLPQQEEEKKKTQNKYNKLNETSTESKCFVKKKKLCRSRPMKTGNRKMNQKFLTSPIQVFTTRPRNISNSWKILEFDLSSSAHQSAKTFRLLFTAYHSKQSVMKALNRKWKLNRLIIDWMTWSWLIQWRQSQNQCVVLVALSLHSCYSCLNANRQENLHEKRKHFKTLSPEKPLVGNTLSYFVPFRFRHITSEVLE